MNGLSDLGRTFISKQNRDQTTCERNQIIEFFQLNDIPLFEDVIHFQENYSGYSFKTGEETIFFRIIQGEGGLPFSNQTAFVDFDKNEDDETYSFICGTCTNDQMIFWIDQTGKFYEGDECVASGFDKIIEGLALFDQIEKMNDVERIGYPFQSINLDSIKSLNLALIEEASDQYVQWYYKDSIYLQNKNNRIKIFAPKCVNIKDQLSI